MNLGENSADVASLPVGLFSLLLCTVERVHNFACQSLDQLQTTEQRVLNIKIAALKFYLYCDTSLILGENAFFFFNRCSSHSKFYTE